MTVDQPFRGTAGSPADPASATGAGQQPAASSGRAAEELELLERVAAGNQQAFQRLYVTYHRRLGGFLLRITGRRELAEELINDVMFVVWRSARSFRHEAQVSTWIMGIAYRQALKSLRRRRNALPPQPVATTPEALMPTDPGQQDRLETQDWLEQAIASLPPKQRLVIEFAYFLGYSCEEIARLANCPSGTVKTRMHAARIRLRDALAQLDHLPAEFPAERNAT